MPTKASVHLISVVVCSGEHRLDCGRGIYVFMKALILLATLKREGLTNTLTLSEFLAEKMEAAKIEVDIVRLAGLNILPGTCSDMGEGDEWPQVLKQIMAADILIFATPIWWNNLSSLMQRVVERLDELQEAFGAGEKGRRHRCHRRFGRSPERDRRTR